MSRTNHQRTHRLKPANPPRPKDKQVKPVVNWIVQARESASSIRAAEYTDDPALD
jgi:hypothetical protein